MQYENAHIRTLFSMNCKSHKKIIIRRKTEHLNVIMIETDFHPWLKVV